MYFLSNIYYVLYILNNNNDLETNNANSLQCHNTLVLKAHGLNLILPLYVKNKNEAIQC